MAKYLVALDDGHGMKTPGKRTPRMSNGKVIHENEFNRAVVKILDEELQRCGIDTLLVSPTDKDTSLGARVRLANSKGADIYQSTHYNAFDGSFAGADPEGFSLHIYPGSVEGRKLAESVMKYLKGGTKQVNRGIKESNFYVLRNTRMAALLTENGFMDNKREASLMLNKDFQKEVAIEHAKGICDYLGVEYKEENKGYFEQGDTGAGVKLLQSDLIELGYHLKADGIYGENTKGAVIQFQRDYELEVDGFAGPQTLGKIEELKNKEQEKPTYRVFVDGKKVAAYKEHDNILKQVNENIQKANKIEIVRI